MSETKTDQQNVIPISSAPTARAAFERHADQAMALAGSASKPDSDPAAVQDIKEAIYGKERGRRLLKAAGFASAVVIAALLVHGEVSSEHNKRSEALESIDGVEDKSIIVVESGAQYRSTPEMISASGDLGNIVDTVEGGKVIVISRGLTSSEHAGWVAASIVDQDATPKVAAEDRVDTTVWFNVAELKEEGYIETMPNPGYNPNVNTIISSGPGEITPVLGIGAEVEQADIETYVAELSTR